MKFDEKSWGTLTSWGKGEEEGGRGRGKRKGEEGKGGREG